LIDWGLTALSAQIGFEKYVAAKKYEINEKVDDVRHW